MRDDGFQKTIKGRLTGAQIRLARIAELQWRGNTELHRPKVMAVRNEQDILDYVVRILRIRSQASREKLQVYLVAEDELLHMSKGKLPTAIQLRAAFDYRISPAVRVAEALYGGKYGPSPTIILREFEESTGWPPAAFEAKLTGDWLERWNNMKKIEAEQRAGLS